MTEPSAEILVQTLLRSWFTMGAVERGAEKMLRDLIEAVLREHKATFAASPELIAAVSKRLAAEKENLEFLLEHQPRLQTTIKARQAGVRFWAQIHGAITNGANGSREAVKREAMEKAFAMSKGESKDYSRGLTSGVSLAFAMLEDSQ